MDFFGALIEKVRSIGFAPLAASQKSKETYTLHTVVRDQLGMVERTDVFTNKNDQTIGNSKKVEVHLTSDMADVAFWDYKELRTFLAKVHNTLNDEVSLIVGKPTNAVAWAHDPSRSQNDVIELFEKARFKHSDLRVPGPAQKRISAKLMVQKRRSEAAIANTLAVLVANGSSYGDLLEQCSHLDLSNESLLDYLDAKVENVGANRRLIDRKSLIPREIVVGYAKKRSEVATSEQESLTVCQFLKSINESNNFAGNSDDRILYRLSAHNVEKV